MCGCGKTCLPHADATRQNDATRGKYRDPNPGYGCSKSSNLGSRKHSILPSFASISILKRREFHEDSQTIQSAMFCASYQSTGPILIRRLLLVGFSGVECGSSIKRNSILEMRKEFQMDLSLAKTPSISLGHRP